MIYKALNFQYPPPVDWPMNVFPADLLSNNIKTKNPSPTCMYCVFKGTVSRDHDFQKAHKSESKEIKCKSSMTHI
jgi:hypothetical protein